ncbi:MAG: penicillin-binding protein 1C, partial [Pseudomonadales bacterium]|nr:penicillin-binding protein 1C [Pseudomonadales bacterium]
IASKPRSSASALKPFLYAAMLDNGDILPQTLIADIPTAYGSYQPTNYDKSYRGAISAQQALIASLNIPAVRMLDEFSYQAFYHQLKALGFTHLFRKADDYGLSLVLGGAEVSLIDLTAAYANLSRQAQSALPVKSLPLQFIEGEQQQGTAMFPISQGAAWLTLQALSQVARPGLHNMHGEFFGARKISWKTGTSYGLRDGWAIGTSSEITVGVWTGNANGEGRHELTGTRAAAPILFDTMNVFNELSWPERPEYALKALEICADNGFLPRHDCARAQSYNPLQAQFEKVSPHHYRVQVDSKTGQRILLGCEKQGAMLSKTFFELPPSQAYFYRLYNSAYKPVPAFADGCKHNMAAIDNAIEITYPRAGQIISLPRYLDGEQGQVILRAKSKVDEGELFWHMDEKYLGSTDKFHEISVSILPGKHVLRVFDESGKHQQLGFSVVP